MNDFETSTQKRRGWAGSATTFLGPVVRQNDIAGEKRENQRHPDRRSPGRSYERKACNTAT